LYNPHLVHKVVDKIVKPEYKDVDVNTHDLDIIKKGMYDVCNSQRGQHIEQCLDYQL